jgi:3-hydroxyacyl-[acyl-carrier-protein] dehydratase
MILDRPAIERLLPQRPPLLLVDRVIAAGDGAEPSLTAALDVRGDEPVLAGHFPGRPLWPGSYTIEGLAQTCALFGGLRARVPDAGAGAVAPLPAPALVAAVKVKLLRPVSPPATLVYRVAHTHTVGDLHRFAVEASVDGALVAQGTLDVFQAARREGGE